jgi:hypothetical protein
MLQGLRRGWRKNSQIDEIHDNQWLARETSSSHGIKVA